MPARATDAEKRLAMLAESAYVPEFAFYLAMCSPAAAAFTLIGWQ
jgi:hypothetical protein